MTLGNEQIQRGWNDSCLAAGLSAVSLDRSAKILAMVFILGGSHSSYTHSKRLRNDLEYIKKRFRIDAHQIPDPEIVPLIRKYSSELTKAWEEAPERNDAGLRINWYPQWAVEIAEYYDLPKNNSI